MGYSGGQVEFQQRLIPPPGSRTQWKLRPRSQLLSSPRVQRETERNDAHTTCFQLDGLDPSREIDGPQIPFLGRFKKRTHHFDGWRTMRLPHPGHGLSRYVLARRSVLVCVR